MKLAMIDLTGAHLGRTITISTNDGDVTGLLLGIQHDAELHEAFAYHKTEPVGRLMQRSTRLTLRGWGDRSFLPETEVTIHEQVAA